MLGNIGGSEIVVIVVLLGLTAFLGKDKVKDIARGLGESTKELKNVKEEYEGAVSKKVDDEPEQEEA